MDLQKQAQEVLEKQGRREIPEKQGRREIQLSGVQLSSSFATPQETLDQQFMGVANSLRSGPFFRSQLIFDQRITGFFETRDDVNEILRGPDIFEVFFILDGPQGTTDGSIYMWHSPDGVNWDIHNPLWLDDVPFSSNTVYRFDNTAFTLSSRLRKITMGVITGTARARLWATSRGMGARRFSELVFDEQMNSGVFKYSDQRLARLLASSDKLQLFAIVDGAFTTDAGAGAPQL